MTLVELLNGLFKEYQVHLTVGQQDEFIERVYDYILDTYGPPF